MNRTWHRRFGLSVFIFLLLFVTTGLALQHAAWFGLGDRYISASMTAELYGVTVDATDFQTANHWVSHAGRFLYMDGAPVARLEMNSLQGAVEYSSVLWVAGDNQLWLLAQDGEMLDELAINSGLPDLATGIGRSAQGGVVIRGLRGNWIGNDEGTVWRPYTGAQPAWAEASGLPAPSAMREKVLAHAGSHLITWERVLLDFHSGRLFGGAGVFIADAAAFLMLLLVASGLNVNLRRRKSSL